MRAKSAISSVWSAIGSVASAVDRTASTLDTAMEGAEIAASASSVYGEAFLEISKQRVLANALEENLELQERIQAARAAAAE